MHLHARVRHESSDWVNQTNYQDWSSSADIRLHESVWCVSELLPLFPHTNLNIRLWFLPCGESRPQQQVSHYFSMKPDWADTDTCSAAAGALKWGMFSMGNDITLQSILVNVSYNTRPVGAQGLPTYTAFIKDIFWDKPGYVVIWLVLCGRNIQLINDEEVRRQSSGFSKTRQLDKLVW